MRALSTMDAKQSRKEWHVNAVLLRTLLAAGALALPTLLRPYGDGGRFDAD